MACLIKPFACLSCLTSCVMFLASMVFYKNKNDLFRNWLLLVCDYDRNPTLSFVSQQNSSCQPNPCQNGGSCVDQADSFVCVCPNGVGGKFCHGENLA